MFFRPRHGCNQSVVYPYTSFDVDCMEMTFDVTEELERYKMVENVEIKDLMSYWNNECVYSCVKCPWGCSEFMSECGMVSYFDVLRHYSSGFIWCNELLPTGGSVKCNDNAKERLSNLSRLYGARPDYMSCIFGWLLGNCDKKVSFEKLCCN